MLKLFIILAMWITPGIVLCLYLLWVSKYRKELRAQPVLPLTVAKRQTRPDGDV